MAPKRAGPRCFPRFIGFACQCGRSERWAFIFPPALHNVPRAAGHLLAHVPISSVLEPRSITARHVRVRVCWHRGPVAAGRRAGAGRRGLVRGAPRHGARAAGEPGHAPDCRRVRPRALLPRDQRRHEGAAVAPAGRVGARRVVLWRARRAQHARPGPQRRAPGPQLGRRRARARPVQRDLSRHYEGPDQPGRGPRHLRAGRRAPGRAGAAAVRPRRA